MATMIPKMSFMPIGEMQTPSYSSRHRMPRILRRQRSRQRRNTMIKLALFARLEAKPGKEAAVADLLATGLALARQESTTPIWFALRVSPTTFGVFDAFHDEA